MQTQLTTKQIKSLEDKIYDTLIQGEEMGMGDMGNCMEAAKEIVKEWMEENNIIEEEMENKYPLTHSDLTDSNYH